MNTIKESSVKEGSVKEGSVKEGSVKEGSVKEGSVKDNLSKEVTKDKIRVYDLARELNLETKDILAVCEQLSIAVKSHSSSILESEAERIRANAPQKGTGNLTDKLADKKSVAAPAEMRAKEPKDQDAKLNSKVDTKLKQQILTVTKPSVTLNSPATMPVEPKLEAKPQDPKTLGQPDRDRHDLEPTVILSPPVSPNSQNNFQGNSQSIPPGKSLVEPTAEARAIETALPPLKVPTSTMPKEAKLEAPAKPKAEPKSVAKLEEPKPPLKAPSAPEVLAATVKPAAAQNTTAPSITAKQAIPKAPVRLQPKPQTIVTVSAAPSIPVETIKPDGQTERVTEKAPIVPKSNLEKPKPPNRVIGIAPEGNKPKPALPSTKPKPVKDAVLIERGITAPSEVPHILRAPTPPTPRTLIAAPERRDRDADAKERNGSSAAGADVVSPDLLVLKDRPMQPRAAKKKTKKEEDDQDVLELKEKAARLKPKRYLQVVDEDDEDGLDEDSLEDTAAADLNLSTARPSARPKARLSKPSIPIAAAIGKAKKANFRDRRAAHQEVVIEKPTKIILRDSIKVHELATELMVAETDIIRVLFIKGMMANINQTLDIPTARLVATELGYEVEEGEIEAPARKVTEMLDVKDLDNLHRRPPVVTIMGHVDHGKTTLLDHIRKSKVAQGEAGGITQHIGAYHVDVEHEGQSQQIVFLDTPGHEAFTAMRARGARVTDVAILVVAADDGVQPQTIEAISHARAAKVPIIVAINKIDKYEAQIDRIKQELTEYGLLDEAWGGDTVMVPVSALTGENIDTLLEMILLVTEVEDLHANPDRPAKGTIIEAHLDKARGPVATFLIQNGTLRVGDVFVAGSVFGKVRAMVDDQLKRVEAASPSFAVEVLGLSEVPLAGDEFEVFLDEKQARALAGERTTLQRQSRLQSAMASRRISLATVSARAQEGELKELNLILKADVQGSLEAILNALEQLPQKEIQVRVLLSAPGEITENDIDLAAASEAIVVGFNTTMATGARQSADEQSIDVRDYSIIYKLLEDIQDAMEGMLEPELVEEPLGQAEVRAVFAVGKGVVAGCYVLNGKLVRNCRVRIRRGKEILHETALDSLKRMKEDTKEVATGFECGVGLPKFNGWQQGDIIEAFRMVTKRRTLAM